jgi:hypothetical protein
MRVLILAGSASKPRAEMIDGEGCGERRISYRPGVSFLSASVMSVCRQYTPSKISPICTPLEY